MTRCIRLLAAAVLTTLTVFTVGCTDQEKLKLQNENDQLVGELEKMRNDNAQLKYDKQRLEEVASGHNTAVAALKDQLSKAQGDLAAAERKLATQGSGNVSAGESAGGWEKGLTGDRVTIGSDVLFASGKADLTAAGKRALDKIAGDLARTYAGLPVRVCGYTDTDPIRRSKWKDNLELSANRAMAVARYLISRGVAAKQIETIGMGEHHPAAGGKAKSRRVEIVVVKTAS